MKEKKEINSTRKQLQKRVTRNERKRLQNIVQEMKDTEKC